MDEETPYGDDKHDHCGHQRPLHALRGAETEDIDGYQAAEVDKHEVDGMGAGADREVDLLGVVVDRVKTPKEWDLMRPAMAPVEPQVAYDEGGQTPQPQWPGGDRSMQARRYEMVCNIRDDRQRDRH